MKVSCRTALFASLVASVAAKQPLRQTSSHSVSKNGAGAKKKEEGFSRQLRGGGEAGTWWLWNDGYDCAFRLENGEILDYVAGENPQAEDSMNMDQAALCTGKGCSSGHVKALAKGERKEIGSAKGDMLIIDLGWDMTDGL